ncbi:MAG: M56 family metallopeptidase [Armatimonadota bacterium]|jgi:Zn-dependent protease with chaperone function
MATVLVGTAIVVATAAAMSLLMALPAVALAETAGDTNAAGRARAWLAALTVPPVAGIAAALWGLLLHAQGIGASPHIGGLRPHLCMLPLRDAPSGAFTLRLLAWGTLALLIAAALRVALAALSSHLLRRTVVASGGRLREGAGELVVDLGRPVSFTAGLLRPVVVVATSLAASLDEASLEAILAHERAHARRRDNLRWLIAEGCAVLLAPMPTAWYFRAKLREAMEEAADDAALEAGVAVEALSVALQVAARAADRRPRTPTLASLLIPEPAMPGRRAARLTTLDPERIPEARGRGRRRAWVAATIGVLLVAVLLVAARRAVEDSLYCAAEQLLQVMG